MIFADIIDILQLEYKPFLILAAQLQTTHEHVQVRTDCSPILFYTRATDSYSEFEGRIFALPKSCFARLN